MKKFEYRSWLLSKPATNMIGELKVMNDLGKEGWELITSFEISERTIRCIFKRELEAYNESK